MTLPSLHITNGPGQRDLEQAFVARNLGAEAKFTIFADDKLLCVGLRIYNFNFVTCHGPNYKLGGQLTQINAEDKKKLPLHNWIFVKYNTEERRGTMEFSNAE